MQLTWYGHAAFGIETDDTRILTDPYSSEIGFAPIDEAFDFVTLSHENPQYHSCLTELRGEFETIDGLALAQNGQFVEKSDLRFGAVEVFEDADGNGPNAMVWLETEGLRVLHMGDCGHLPTPEQIAACGHIDVLLALAGGPPTIEIPDLMRFIEALQPRLIVPMHYGLPQLKSMQLQSVEALTSAFPPERVLDVPSSVVMIAPATLPDAPTLLIVPPAR